MAMLKLFIAICRRLEIEGWEVNVAVESDWFAISGKRPSAELTPGTADAPT